MYFYRVTKVDYPEDEWYETLLHEKQYTQEEFTALCKEIERETYLPGNVNPYNQENVFVGMIIDNLCKNHGFKRIELTASFEWSEDTCEK